MVIDKTADQFPERRFPSDTPDFSFYERFCNEHNQSARKAGILAAEQYAEIINDPSTLFMVFGDQRVPVLIDVSHGSALGYDAERSKELATEDQVSILAVPLGDLDDEAQKSALEVIQESGQRSLFFADNEGRDLEVLRAGLKDKGVAVNERPLLDERADEEHQQASLSLYAVDVLATDDAERSRKKSLEVVQQHFDEESLPTIEDPSNSVLIRRGDSFSEAELDEIWRLYEDRFQYLGEQHPISMEDNQEDFLELFADPQVMVVIKYNDGAPVCFTFFTEDIGRMTWLNKPYFDADTESLDSAQTTLFFPGIVASKESRGRNAAEVIGTFADEVAQSGISFRLYFENTNFSEQYIPTIVYRAAEGRPEFSLSQPRKLDETKYRLVQLS